jgi:hypothetical protein
MANIYAPNKQYTGISAGVGFISGVGETDKPYLLDWFKTHGYTVEKVKQPADKKSDRQLVENPEEKAKVSENIKE